MSRQVEPWVHRERGWSFDGAAQSETMLALSNGYLGVRGTLDEGAPAAAAGTYLGGFYETRPIPYAERGYGDPDFDQVLVDVVDGTRIRLIVQGEPLDVRTGTVVAHERVLDLRSGLLVRTLRWRSPSGHEVRLRTRRLVSLSHRELAAIEYELEATERPVEVAVHSELDARPPQCEVVGSLSRSRRLCHCASPVPGFLVRLELEAVRELAEAGEQVDGRHQLHDPFVV